MRRERVLLVTLALIGGAACGSAPPDTAAGDGAVAPIELAPPGSAPDGTAPKGNLGAKIVPSPTPEYLRQVGAATREKSTGRIRMVAAANGGRGNEGRVTPLTTLEGAYDNGANRSRTRLDPTGSVKAGATGLAALFKAPVEIIQIGDVSYVDLGAGRWTRTEGSGTSALQPIFSMFKVDDVDRFMAALGCAAPIVDAGREAIDGVATNHYKVDAQAAKLKECAARDDNANSLLANLGESERARVDVWVDEASLVRRIVITCDERALGQEIARRYPGTTSTLTMTLTGFGEPVDIQPPPADKVTAGSGLEGLLGGAGGEQVDLDELLSGLGG